jgi:hypothetical protein
MSEPREFKSMQEFWPFYLSQHSPKVTRVLHLIGGFAALAVLVSALVLPQPWLLLLLPVAGYGPAWIGHFYFEKNRPATFRHPFYSLLGDVRMCTGMVIGFFKRLLNIT